MKLLKRQEGKMVDISDKVGNIRWNDSIDTLGQQMTFDFTKVALTSGDYLKLINEENEVISGIATSINKMYKKNTLTVHDFAWYLNKSEEIIQFNQMDSVKAIKKLLTLYNVPIGKIGIKSIIISKIYKDQKVSQIIKDILKQTMDKTGEKYRVEMRNNQFYIERYTKLEVSPTFKPADNLKSFDVRKTIEKSFSYQESIDDLRNAIVIVSDGDESSRIVAKASNQDSINQYGRLQLVESVSDENIASADLMAKKKLEDLNKKGIDFSITVPGDVKLKSGRYIELNNNYFKGDFLIKSTSHHYNNGIYKTSLVLGDDKNDVG